MITCVLLNWKRPDNVCQIIKSYESVPLISEVIVWNNNPDRTFVYNDRRGLVRIVNSATDMGLYTRFAASCLAASDCLLIQDDDIVAPQATIETLHAAWRDDPSILHGVFGRSPKPDGSYATLHTGNADVPVVLTRMLLARRPYAAAFFVTAPQFASIQRSSEPFGNGEDIIFSYVAQKISGKLNKIHAVSTSELSAEHAIHRRYAAGHLAHRTRVLRACSRWLAEQR